ncbi:MAG: hypothetical protein ABJE95_31035 [Byssovorax sp.]
MKSWKLACVTGAVVAFTSISAGVHAFSNAGEWHEPADGPFAAGGDIHGTGSNHDWGITCAHCHTNDKQQQGKIDFTIVASPAFGKKNGLDSYVPGTTYQITTAMVGEHLGMGLSTNFNGFGLTIEDQSGTTQGIFMSDETPPKSSVNCVAVPTLVPDAIVKGSTTVRGDCHTLVSLAKTDVTTWHFSWQAPPAGAGQLTIYYGVVDADYTTNGSTRSSLGDDVKIGTKKLVEGP